MNTINCPVCGHELPLTLEALVDVNGFTCKHCNTAFALSSPHTGEVVPDPTEQPSVTEQAQQNVAMNPYVRSENRDVGHSERLDSIEFSYQEDGESHLLVIPVRQKDGHLP